ncbi:MAG: type I secretion system permease/ATPase [Polaromonas sp.]|uniref:type I secretion system permease/ATPase n=1 Tax=Polaromonas sp. TaxID=1869339 RepID=UPI002736B5C1|nr:type I secretion system permease/ATPase [Polaromonas sp.]MDP3798211.1 type I secretion system permease/ATPase [Polaromonas sp.]
MITAQLELLRLYAKLHNIHLDSEQLRHQFASYGPNGEPEPFGPGETLQALRALGFEASMKTGKRQAVMAAMLPALMPMRDGGLMLVGQIDSAPAKQDIKPDAMQDATDSGGAVVLQCAGDTEPRQISLAEFDQLFTGQWMVATRSVAQPAHNRAGHDAGDAQNRGKFGIGWFWQSLKKYRSLMGEVLLASLFVQIIALITPLIFQVVIDKVLTHRTLSTLDVMVMALMGVSIFEVVLGTMRHYLLSHTTNRVDVELGSKLFSHLLHLPLPYFESRRSGDTVARVRELDNARNFLTGQALTSWLDLLFAVVYLAVMFYYSVTLTLVVIVALPVFFGASALITPLLRQKLEDKFALGAENQAYLVETVTSMETLKSHAVEPQWQREWDKRLASYVNAAFEGGHLGNATNQFISLASKLLTVLLLWLGAKLVIDGELTVGGLIAFNMLAGRVNAPILKLSSLWQDFTQMKVSIKRLADIMDAPPEPAFQPNRSTPPAVQGRVTFEHVGFRYSPKAPEVLSDLSFEVRPGEVIGVVGISGAGKTTLMRLVQRLYTPDGGRILIDGIDLNLVDTAWLRRQIGVVGQDTLLFNRSVRDNIALADNSLEMDAVMNAAQLSGAHDFILQLPEGYDTVIGERGSKLSGGQRARIAIARALVTNPRLLLLDEATAALDYESERLIHDNMASITQGRTVLIVAHRLSTLRLADRIMVLDKGRLIETGQHASLMQNRGRYASLYQAHQVLETQGLVQMQRPAQVVEGVMA